MSKTSFPRLDALNYPAQGGYNLAAANFSDTIDLDRYARRFISDIAGTVVVTTVGGDKLTIPVLAGVMVDVSVKKVWATGSTGGITLSMFI